MPVGPVTLIFYWPKNFRASQTSLQALVYILMCCIFNLGGHIVCWVTSLTIYFSFSAHMIQKVMLGIAITWCPLSIVCKPDTSQVPLLNEQTDDTSTDIALYIFCGKQILKKDRKLQNQNCQAH